MTKKTMIATRDFKDAGTEREFKAGETLTDVEPGALENYRAANLIEEGPEEPSATPAPRKRRTRASKLN